jgi:hypothetical protein
MSDTDYNPDDEIFSLQRAVITLSASSIWGGVSLLAGHLMTHLLDEYIVHNNVVSSPVSAFLGGACISVAGVYSWYKVTGTSYRAQDFPASALGILVGMNGVGILSWIVGGSGSEAADPRQIPLYAPGHSEPQDTGSIFPQYNL